MAENDPKQTGDAGNGAKGAPDLEQQIERQKAEIATLKADKESLAKQLEDEKAAREKLDKQLAEALTDDDIKAAVEKAREDAKAQAEAAEKDWREREKRLTVENALIAAGCIDAQAAMAHIDMDKVEVASDGHVSGLDTRGLAEGRPYLFDTSNAGVSSAANPAGGQKTTKSRKEIAEIADPQERRRLLAECEASDR